MRPRPLAPRGLPTRIIALACACGALLGLVLATVTATVRPAPRPTAAAFSCGVTMSDWNTIITGGPGCPQ